jgi:hypothetical protein
MISVAEPGLSIIRLTRRERETLLECEREVEASISQFVRCSRALARIRSGRLYREAYSTFEAYCLECWGMSHSACDILATSFRIYEQLESEGVDVGDTATQSSMRALQRLPAIAGMRSATWRYARELCPDAPCPPLSLLHRVCGIIRDALDDADEAGNCCEDEEEPSDIGERRPPRTGARKKKVQPRDERFLRAVTRMAC